MSVSEVTPEFQDALDGLRGYLTDLLVTPHQFGGENVVGATLQPLMIKICESVSNNGSIAPLRYTAALDYGVTAGVLTSKGGRC